jgi:hypothetical protein
MNAAEAAVYWEIVASFAAPAVDILLPKNPKQFSFLKRS